MPARIAILCGANWPLLYPGSECLMFFGLLRRLFDTGAPFRGPSAELLNAHRVEAYSVTRFWTTCISHSLL